MVLFGWPLSFSTKVGCPTCAWYSTSSGVDVSLEQETQVSLCPCRLMMPRCFMLCTPCAPVRGQVQRGRGGLDLSSRRRRSQRPRRWRWRVFQATLYKPDTRRRHHLDQHDCRWYDAAHGNGKLRFFLLFGTQNWSTLQTCRGQFLRRTISIHIHSDRMEYSSSDRKYSYSYHSRPQSCPG